MSINRCVQVEKEKDSEMQAPSQPLPLSPTLLEEFSEDEYKFTHAKRGRAVIINNENFSIASGCGNRPGSSQDASRLKEVFKTLGFEVRLYHDLTAQLMFAALEKGICCLMLYSRNQHMFKKSFILFTSNLQLQTQNYEGAINFYL